ncbi:MAG: hypothetical protein IT440_10870 [Phycisphaeraceae bacterium]|nr:hypothetical protein [Phycisphaeraceae bacterium]
MTAPAPFDLCFVICEGCGPEGLEFDLLQLARSLSPEGFDIQVRRATCLSACRFGHVVYVREPDGALTGYSGRDQNGFHAFGDRPLDDLIFHHIPRQFHGTAALTPFA